MARGRGVVEVNPRMWRDPTLIQHCDIEARLYVLAVACWATETGQLTFTDRELRAIWPGMFRPRTHRRRVAALCAAGVLVQGDGGAYTVVENREWFRLGLPLAPMSTRETWRYRLSDVFGRLLYVGITHDLEKRLARHSVQQPWWGEVSHVEAHLYPDRTTAAAEEAHDIARLRPAYNRAQPYMRGRSGRAPIGEVYRQVRP